MSNKQTTNNAIFQLDDFSNYNCKRSDVHHWAEMRCELDGIDRMLATFNRSTAMCFFDHAAIYTSYTQERWLSTIVVSFIRAFDAWKTVTTKCNKPKMSMLRISLRMAWLIALVFYLFFTLVFCFSRRVHKRRSVSNEVQREYPQQLKYKFQFRVQKKNACELWI